MRLDDHREAPLLIEREGDAAFVSRTPEAAGLLQAVARAARLPVVASGHRTCYEI
jgi:hypothetical protein